MPRELFSRRQTFTGFGPHGIQGHRTLSGVQVPLSSLGPVLDPVQLGPLFVVRGRPSRLRAQVRNRCPRLPGVYGMVDATGTIIYIGKAKNLRTRLLTYFRPNSREPKAGRILDDTRLLAWEPGPCEFSALLRELELIRRWQPRFNVQGQPRRLRRCYICMGRTPAPHAFVSRRPPTTAAFHFGPISAGQTVREAARHLNDWFGLRDCPQSQEMVFRDQQELFPIVRAPGCIRHEIGNCLGPCAALCTQNEYDRNLHAARAFLEGADSSPLDSLEREMIEASTNLAFERAAALRDKLTSLRWLTESLQRVREGRHRSCIYPVDTHEGKTLWYFIHQGYVRTVLPCPEDPPGRQAALRVLKAIFHPAHPLPEAPTLEQVDGVMLVLNWFRSHPEEEARALSPERVLESLTGDG